MTAYETPQFADVAPTSERRRGTRTDDSGRSTPDGSSPTPTIPPQTVANMGADELVDAYAGFVKHVSLKVLDGLSYTVPLDDLVGWGFQGLLEAHQRFDPTLEVTFPSFSFYRIRGAIYDGLRSTGWAERGTAIRMKDVLAVNDYLESNLLANSDTPRSKSFDASVDYIDGMVGDCVTICLLENTRLEMVSKSDPATQRRNIQRRETSKALHEAITTRLSSNERDVLLAYHIEEWSMSEIADQMGYSKSWVSRINARALQKLKRALFKHGDPEELYMIRG